MVFSTRRRFYNDNFVGMLEVVGTRRRFYNAKSKNKTKQHRYRNA